MSETGSRFGTSLRCNTNQNCKWTLSLATSPLVVRALACPNCYCSINTTSMADIRPPLNLNTHHSLYRAFHALQCATVACVTVPVLGSVCDHGWQEWIVPVGILLMRNDTTPKC
jgi:hypothetical protein